MKLSRWAFALLAILMLCMVLATGMEPAAGTDYVLRHVYHSGWFGAGWALTAVLALAALWQSRAREWRLWLWHGSLATILAGAGLSALTSQSGSLHLRQGVAASSFVTDGERPDTVLLPFTLQLERFKVVNHMGTLTPQDYVSHLLVDGQPQSVGMNRPLQAEGYTLCQASFDDDGCGTVLLVRHDPWGWPVTLLGYALLLAAIMTEWLGREGGLRRTARQLRRLSAVAMCCACACAVQAQATPRTLPADEAEAMGRLYVAYGGRICPMQTLAQDFCRKLSGRTSYAGFSAEQVMMGWLLWPDDWNKEPLIAVKSSALRRRLNVKRRASLNDFFMNGYRLGPLFSANRQLAQAAADVDDRIQLVYRLRRGELFRMFPVPGSDGIVWQSPVEPVGASLLAPADSALVGQSFSWLFRHAAANDLGGVRRDIEAMASYQQRLGGHTLPDPHRVKAERLYQMFDLPYWLCRMNLLAGLAGLLFVLWRRRPAQRGGQPGQGGGTLHPQSWARWSGPGLCLYHLTAWAALTVFLALRTYVGGRLPMGNGYETMLCGGWAVMLACEAQRWLPSVGLSRPAACSIALTASGFFLLVATLGASDAGISQLQPVLHSPLLSLHVSLTMLSDALLSLAVLHSLCELLRPSLGTQASGLLRTRLLLIPAVGLLAIGIFLGACWARTTWGRYWGWDPKEVWALITWLLYALPLHSRSLPLLGRPRLFHAYVVVAFAAVLFTYFGVNYLLGGMHSYA